MTVISSDNFLAVFAAPGNSFQKMLRGQMQPVDLIFLELIQNSDMYDANPGKDQEKGLCHNHEKLARYRVMKNWKPRPDVDQFWNYNGRQKC